MRKATICLDDHGALEHVISGVASVDPDIRPTLVKALDDGSLRLSVRFSREIEVAELIVAGVVQIDEDAGYVAVGRSA